MSTTGGSLGEDFVAALLDDLALLSDTVIVFDTFESIRNGALLADISQIIEHAPKDVHFVVATRSDAAIGMHRFLVRGQLGELRQSDLAMNDKDAAELIRRVARIELDGDAVRVLVDRTEGWPAGLHLAALSLRGHDDPAEFVRTFSGDDRHVADFLADEVLNRQSEDVRDFLLETSVLKRMSGPLCDAMTGRSDSQSTLVSIERAGLPVIRLDDTRFWFRYHALLRDLLHRQQRSSDWTRTRELLHRAARWHAQRGELEDASEYLIETQDWDAVIDFVRNAGRPMFEGTQPSLLIDWLAAIPDEVRRARIDVSLSWIAALGLTGRSLAADDEATYLQETRTLTPWQEAVVETIRASWVVFHTEPRRALAAARRALECLDSVGSNDEPVDILGLTSVSLLRVLAQLAIGHAWVFLGETKKGREYLTASAADAEGTYLVWMLNALSALACLDARDGELTRALGRASRVLELASDNGLSPHPATAEAYLAIAAVSRDRNQLDAASVALDEALIRIRRNRRLATMSFHTAEAAQLSLAQGRPQDGFDELSHSRTDGRPPPQPLPAACLAAFEAQLLLAVGNSERAQNLLDDFDGLNTSDVAAAEIAVAVARRDVPAARKALEAFPEQTCRRARVQHAIWTAVIADLGGDKWTARDSIAAAVAEAELEGMVRVFLDSGTDVLRLLRSLYRQDPTPFLREIVDRKIAVPPAQSRVSGIVEQLSDREIIVLRYLPSRLSNSEIARNLYVSVNTLKTHLKHIYRKLDVANRSEAIEKAESLRLL
ncbi:MAG: LuxR C-terminal-related transcriptional regulator [Acidimicrobiia bacterium]